MKKKRKAKRSDTTTITVNMPISLVAVLNSIADIAKLDMSTVCNVMLAMEIWRTRFSGGQKP